MIDTKTAKELIDQLDKGMGLARVMETAVTSFDTWAMVTSAEWWKIFSSKEMEQLSAVEAAIDQAHTTSANAAAEFYTLVETVKHRMAEEQKDPDVTQFISLREQLTTCNPTRESDIAAWRAEMLDLYRILKGRYDSGEIVKLLIFQEGYESLIEPAY